MHFGMYMMRSYLPISGPNSIAKTTVEKEGDRYAISYVPVEVGIFDISIVWKGKEIPGQ